MLVVVRSCYRLFLLRGVELVVYLFSITIAAKRIAVNNGKINRIENSGVVSGFGEVSVGFEVCVEDGVGFCMGLGRSGHIYYERNNIRFSYVSNCVVGIYN